MIDSQTREQAWVGDAVLALYARLWALAHVPERLRPEFFVHFTANRTLATQGEPTRVEAKIGVIFEREGLQAAFDHIASELHAILVVQWNNKHRSAQQHRLPLQTPRLLVP